MTKHPKYEALWTQRLHEVTTLDDLDRAMDQWWKWVRRAGCAQLPPSFDYYMLSKDWSGARTRIARMTNTVPGAEHLVTVLDVATHQRKLLSKTAYMPRPVGDARRARS
jgi:hypothetical protein